MATAKQVNDFQFTFADVDFIANQGTSKYLTANTLTQYLNQSIDSNYKTRHGWSTSPNDYVAKPNHEFTITNVFKYADFIRGNNNTNSNLYTVLKNALYNSTYHTTTWHTITIASTTTKSSSRLAKVVESFPIVYQVNIYARLTGSPATGDTHPFNADSIDFHLSQGYYAGPNGDLEELNNDVTDEYAMFAGADASAGMYISYIDTEFDLYKNALTLQQWNTLKTNIQNSTYKTYYTEWTSTTYTGQSRSAITFKLRLPIYSSVTNVLDRTYETTNDDLNNGFIRSDGFTYSKLYRGSNVQSNYLYILNNTSYSYDYKVGGPAYRYCPQTFAFSEMLSPNTTTPVNLNTSTWSIVPFDASAASGFGSSTDNVKNSLYMIGDSSVGYGILEIKNIHYQIERISDWYISPSTRSSTTSNTEDWMLVCPVYRYKIYNEIPPAGLEGLPWYVNYIPITTNITTGIAYQSSKIDTTAIGGITMYSKYY